MQAGQLFIVNQKHIEAEARHKSLMYGVAYDECLSEGFVIFMEAFASWDSEKSSFRTWLTRNLDGRLRNFCQKERPHLYVDMVEAPTSEFALFQRALEQREIFSELPVDSQVLLDELLTYQWYDPKAPQRRPSASGRVGMYYHMQSWFGWGRRRFEKAWNDLQGGYSQLVHTY